MFKKGDVVTVNVTIPSGPILAMRMDEEGTVMCLVEWTEKGQKVTRWFEQDQLTAG
jgi:hypothetical protein